MGPVPILLLGLVLCAPAAAQELCAAAGKPEMPKPRPGASAPDPCDSLAVLAKVVGVCAAELPNDRALQVHAAGILGLERQRKIEAGVVASLREMLASPQRMQAQGVDPALLRKRTDDAAGRLAQIESELAEGRKRAVAAGYRGLGEEGFAQKVISNAVWRYLQPEVSRALAACARDEAGRREASEFGAALAVMSSHGNAFEREVLRRIREGR